MDDKMKLLSDAYWNCNIEKLEKAIELGLDLNMKDDDGEILWGNLHYSIDWAGNTGVNDFSAYILKSTQIVEEKNLIGFLSLAIQNGLNLNEAIYEEKCKEYQVPIFWLLCDSYCPKLVSFLVKNADINLLAGNKTLLDLLEEELWLDELAYNEENPWMRWIVKYLKEHGAKTYAELQNYGNTHDLK